MYLSEQVLHWIEEYIEKKQLSVGDPLPSENEIALEMGRARHTVREAVTALKALGIIQSKRRGGITIIRDPALLELRHYFSNNYDDDKLYADALEFRTIMEWGLASLALSRITPQTIEALRKVLQETEQGPGTEEDVMRAEIEFHRILTNGYGNRLAELLTHLYEPIFEKYRKNTRNELSDASRWINDHSRIVDALESGNASTLLKEFKIYTHDYMRDLSPKE